MEGINSFLRASALNFKRERWLFPALSLNDDTHYLSSISLFSQFGEEHLRLLAFGSDTIDYSAETVIFKENQASDGGYYIISGNVELSLSVYPDQVALLGPGDLLGEMAMITRNRRVGSAVTKTDCQLLRISRTTLVRVLREFPHLAVGIQEQISASIVNFAEQLTTVEQAIANAD